MHQQYGTATYKPAPRAAAETAPRAAAETALRAPPRSLSLSLDALAGEIRRRLDARAYEIQQGAPGPAPAPATPPGPTAVSVVGGLTFNSAGPLHVTRHRLDASAGERPSKAVAAALAAAAAEGAADAVVVVWTSWVRRGAALEQRNLLFNSLDAAALRTWGAIADAVAAGALKGGCPTCGLHRIVTSCCVACKAPVACAGCARDPGLCRHPDSQARGVHGVEEIRQCARCAYAPALSSEKTCAACCSPRCGPAARPRRRIRSAPSLSLTGL